jgi:predicted ATPase
MIKLIEAKNYRCLKYICQPLKNFQVLVGANASGKTTFLDVISFIADIINKGIDIAIKNRSSNYVDLTYADNKENIELAVEVTVPKTISDKFPDEEFDIIRYEVQIGLDEVTEEHIILEERVLLLKNQEKLTISNKNEQRTLFPEEIRIPSSILNKKYVKKSSRLVIRKRPKGNDNFYNETTPSNYRSGGWLPSFKLGGKKSALGNLPTDETKFPASTWLKYFLEEGVQKFVLDSMNIRQASPPGQSKKFNTDGSNLPWIIEDLRKNKKRFNNWLSHIRLALPDIKDIKTVEREDDRHRYLKVHYNNGIEVPSWLVSDGTLRLLALTLPAYIQDFQGVYLIEEPENGIHPKAIETVLQSLSSVYNAQILLASHSPIILSSVKIEDILCFAKTDDGITDIVQGNLHPMLKDWKGETDLSVLFAGGILG